MHFNLLQLCRSVRDSVYICCVISYIFPCFDQLFLCFTQFCGGSRCLNFDEFPGTALLNILCCASVLY